MKKRQSGLLIAFDIVELLLILVGFIVFTFAFCLISTEAKYLFLVADIYGIYVFAKTVDDLGKNIKEIINIKKQLV